VIYVLKEGRVVEIGMHQELYERGGTYYEIFNASARSLIWIRYRRRWKVIDGTIASRLEFFRHDHNRNAKWEIEVFQPKPFRAEKFSENAVQGRYIYVVFRFGFYTGYFH